MAKKRENAANDPSKIQVKLKPFLGMKPGLYLTIFYAFLVVVVLFLLLVLPGLRRFGSVVAFTTTPPGAAVFVDGRFLGATPLQAFVPAGSHTLELQKPYYDSVERKITIGGRLFGSLFAPRRVEVSATIRIGDLSKLLAGAFAGIGRWALVSTVVPNYQLPPIMSHTVRDAVESKGFTDYSALARFLAESARDVHNQFLLRDLLSAEGYLYARGAMATPAALLAMVDGFAQAAQSNPQLVLWAYHSLPSSMQKQVSGTAWFEDLEKGYAEAIGSGAPEVGGTTAPALSIGGIRFVPVPAGRFAMGLERGVKPPLPSNSGLQLAHRVDVASFSMAATDVTGAQFERFIAANPQWSPARRAELVREGRADSSYLSTWSSTAGSSYPVTFVSYYAAQAYCDWLTSLLPGYLSGWRVRLPSEAEYEWAAGMDVNPRRSVFHDTAHGLEPAGSGAPNSLGIYDLLGEVWEWTDTWYLPADYLLAPWRAGRSFEPMSYFPAAEVAVRGGSFASSREGVGYTTRAAQPPTWCTPFLGFRPVLARE